MALHGFGAAQAAPCRRRATNWCDKGQTTPYNMISPALAPSAPNDDELAKAKRLLAKHPQLVALLGEAVADESDRPASHYGRVNALVAALLVLDANCLPRRRRPGMRRGSPLRWNTSSSHWHALPPGPSYSEHSILRRWDDEA